MTGCGGRLITKSIDELAQRAPRLFTSLNFLCSANSLTHVPRRPDVLRQVDAHDVIEANAASIVNGRWFIIPVFAASLAVKLARTARMCAASDPMARNIKIQALRILPAHKPTSDDIERARGLSARQCPRRYCWWWQSLSFDWETPVKCGCAFPTKTKPDWWPGSESPCMRAVAESKYDHFEPREPHLIEDGLSPDRWVSHLQ